MSNNTFGRLLRLTTFGESHGPALGGVIDGFPAGIAIDMDFIRSEMARRRPGSTSLGTKRNESRWLGRVVIRLFCHLFNLIFQS